MTANAVKKMPISTQAGRSSGIGASVACIESTVPRHSHTLAGAGGRYRDVSRHQRRQPDHLLSLVGVVDLDGVQYLRLNPALPDTLDIDLVPGHAVRVLRAALDDPRCAGRDRLDDVALVRPVIPEAGSGA